MASSLAERQLILLSAGTAARREQRQEQAGRLVVGLDWQRLTETLRSRKLLPVLGPRILELAKGSADDAFADEVRESIEAGRRQGAFLQLISLRVTAMLAEAGIRSTPLKGPLLGEAIHGDPGRRLSTDIDLLVAPEQLQQAVDVVRGLGYGAPVDHVYEHGLPLLHYVLLHERGELPSVELHWRVHWYERSFARERLLAPSVDGAKGWQPARVDELAALLLFYARDGFVDLRLASDLSAWWDVFGAEVQPEMMDELLHAYPELARVISAAVEVAAKTVGLPARKIISDRHRLGLRGRIAVRLANPNPDSSPAQIYADMGLIDGLLAPRGGFGGFVRRQVLPPSEVLDQHARYSERSRQRSMLGRGAGVVARYGLTMTRLLRAPQSLQ
ncbi:MAG: nucleotidyltransferase family protein [Solirubrobacteraceae bacterium]